MAIIEWEIIYYSKALQEEIMALPAGVQARYIHITKRMRMFGANLGMPHTQSIRDGLFEIRLKSKEGIGRVFYCTLVNKRIVMLHCFIKKSQKIPKHDLKIAISRMKEVKANAYT
jgi:phage-related protein